MMRAALDSATATLGSRPSLAERTFVALLDRGVVDARLAVRMHGQLRIVGGRDAPPGPLAATIDVHAPRFFSRVLALGNLGLGEAYIDGDFDVEQDRLPELLTTLRRPGLTYG